MGYYINPAIFNSRVHCLILHSESAEEGVYDNKLMTIRQQSAVETGGSSGDPLNPLKKQLYFHSTISREEAEGMLSTNGEFLVRESTKKPGQFVLTGMSHGHPQHLLLMDK